MRTKGPFNLLLKIRNTLLFTTFRFLFRSTGLQNNVFSLGKLISYFSGLLEDCLLSVESDYLFMNSLPCVISFSVSWSFKKYSKSPSIHFFSMIMEIIFNREIFLSSSNYL